MSEAEALDMKAALESKAEVEFKVCTLGKDVTIKQNIVSINMEKKKEHQRKFTPSVIEVLNPPSGLDALYTASLNIASTKGLAKRRMSN